MTDPEWDQRMRDMRKSLGLDHMLRMPDDATDEMPYPPRVDDPA